jgi:hypothetical protein
MVLIGIGSRTLTMTGIISDSHLTVQSSSIHCHLLCCILNPNSEATSALKLAMLFSPTAGVKGPFDWAGVTPSVHLCDLLSHPIMIHHFYLTPEALLVNTRPFSTL